MGFKQKLYLDDYNPNKNVGIRSDLILLETPNGDSELLMVGGGGSGGTTGADGGGGGGGAGAYYYTSEYSLNYGTFPVVIGAGGTGLYATRNGETTSFDNILVLGGGSAGLSASNGYDGGSGGGGSQYGLPGLALTLTGYTGIGNDGGNGANTSFWCCAGGGGGGAGAVGEDVVDISSPIPGDGGDGIQCPIDNQWYAGGGGGHSDPYTPMGLGGQGGGGNALADGTPNTGGGGGGKANGAGYEGGSGILKIKYIPNIPDVYTYGGVISYDGIYKIHTFTSNDDFVVSSSPIPTPTPTPSITPSISITPTVTPTSVTPTPTTSSVTPTPTPSNISTFNYTCNLYDDRTGECVYVAQVHYYSDTSVTLEVGKFYRVNFDQPIYHSIVEIVSFEGSYPGEANILSEGYDTCDEVPVWE